MLKNQALTNSERADVLIGRAGAYEELGKYQNEIDDSNEALRLRPGYAVAYYTIGNGYRKLGDHSSAIKNYDEAIRLDPKYSWAYNNRGAVYQVLKRYQESIADFTSAIRYDSTNYNALFNRGNSYRMVGDCEHAIEDYSAYARYVPGDGDGPVKLAWVLATCPNGQYRNGQKALKVAQLAVTLKPQAPDAHESLAAAYANLGQWNDAVREETKALTLLKSRSKVASARLEDAERRLRLYQAHKPYRDLRPAKLSP
jgi:tetratricopeptide (TPR) repeat protein